MRICGNCGIAEQRAADKIVVDSMSDTIYRVSENIIRIQADTDVCVVLNNTNASAVINKYNKALNESALIGTGMQIVLIADEKTVDNLYVVVVADIDCDGKITANDARDALRASVGLDKIEKASPQYAAGDVDGNGSITASDAWLILRASVGLENSKEWV